MAARLPDVAEAWQIIRDWVWWYNQGQGQPHSAPSAIEVWSNTGHNNQLKWPDLWGALHIMKTKLRVMLLEFNELSPILMNRFMEAGNLPHFSQFYNESQVYTTEATEREWDLNPWVQWVTVHSGLDYQDHGITELDEGGKLRSKRVWDVVSDAGLSVWVCGSMNVAYHTPINGLVLPDPWTTKVAPYPETLKLFYQFVQRNVLEHSKGQVPLSWSDYLSFLAYMLTHGLSFITVKAIVQQLLSERTSGQYWRRATLLDKLQFDMFRSYYQKTRPHFSTFFSNSTAHFQHYFWREMEPHLFKVQPTLEQRVVHGDAILFGYQEMDKLIGRFLALADPDTIVIFATAISQQPCLVYEEQGGKVMYRPRDFSRLMSLAGITEPYTISPVMAEVFNVQLESEIDATRVEAKLRTLCVDGHQAMQLQNKGTAIHVKCQVHHKLSASANIGCSGQREAVPFFDIFYQLEEMKSGMHDPDGILWIRMPEKEHRIHRGKVPLASVAPTILQLLSLPRPVHMKAPPLAV